MNRYQGRNVTSKTGPKPRSVAERLWSKVQVGQLGGCWECAPSMRNSRRGGYGTLNVGGRGGGTQRAHRVAYEVTYGPIPDGALVLHSCDNPPCCNPAHLFLGDHATNSRDMVNKGRTRQQQKTHCPQGHEYTPQNTRLVNGGRSRRCRSCEVAR